MKTNNLEDQKICDSNVFEMIEVLPNIESVAEIIIPRPEGEKDIFWTNSVREILRGCLLHCIVFDNKSSNDLNRLTSMSKIDLIKQLENIEGAEFACSILNSGTVQGDNFISNFKGKVPLFIF